eukprot:1158106-Pelagomonas_calceolata.AAC.15
MPSAPQARTPAAFMHATRRCLLIMDLGAWMGHYTFECKNEPAYQSRPSRTQQLKNPKVNAQGLGCHTLHRRIRRSPDFEVSICPLCPVSSRVESLSPELPNSPPVCLSPLAAHQKTGAVLH